MKASTVRSREPRVSSSFTPAISARNTVPASMPLTVR